MSAASLRVLKGQIDRGTADLATVDVWQTKKLLTAAEAEEARAYWHTLYDPPPPPPVEPTPEPTPEPPAPEEPPAPPAGEPEPSST